MDKPKMPVRVVFTSSLAGRKRSAGESCFPNPDFDYGGTHRDYSRDYDIDILCENLKDITGQPVAANKSSCEKFRAHPWPESVAQPIGWLNSPPSPRGNWIPFQLHWLKGVSRKGLDAKVFWDAVLLRHPPRLRPKDVLTLLCTIPPMQLPSDTTIYKNVMERIEKCRAMGAEHSWNDNADTTKPDFPDDAMLEAMRIYGSSDGINEFGVLPNAIIEALKDAGIYFLVVHKNKRIVPLFWRKGADACGIQYARTAPSLDPLASKEKRVASTQPQPASSPALPRSVKKSVPKDTSKIFKNALRISKCFSRISKVEGRLTMLETENAQLKNRTHDLEAENESLKNQVCKLDNEVVNLKNRNAMEKAANLESRTKVLEHKMKAVEEIAWRCSEMGEL